MDKPQTPAEPAPPADPGRTVAQRLQERLLQKPKHVLGTVAEAEPLLAACDAVITITTGIGLQILCLVDREAHPERVFGLDRAALSKIAGACAKYNAPVYGAARPPAIIQVWEIGKGPLSDADRARLSQIKPTFRADLSAWYIDASNLSVWTNKRATRAARRYLEMELRHLDEPVFDPAQAAAHETAAALARAHSDSEAAPPPAHTGLPFVTIGLLSLFVAVFVLEHVFAVDSGEKSLGLSVSTLISLGGVSRSLLASGEWWRVFTAPLLHGDIFHLLFNGVAFAMVSLFLEQLLGRAWLLALFAVGGVGGSLMSAAAQNDVVSVGASGAIMGLFAGAMVAALRLPAGPHRTQVQVQLARVLIPSLLPAASAATEGGKIDFAAHFGGAIAGLLLGLLILWGWRRRPNRIPLQLAARVLAVLGVIAFSAGIAEAAVHYRGWADALKLATADEIGDLNQAIDVGPDTALEHADAFVARFPSDPRGHLVHAMLLARQDREDEGAKELQAVLGRPLALQLFQPALEARTRATLGAMLVDLDRKDEAKAVVVSVCALKEGDAVELVKKLNLCE